MELKAKKIHCEYLGEMVVVREMTARQAALFRKDADQLDATGAVVAGCAFKSDGKTPLFGDNDDALDSSATLINELMSAILDASGLSDEAGAIEQGKAA